MEGRKQIGSSSFTSELFGSDQSQKSSSSGIFESMFSPPSKVLRRESLRSEVNVKTSSEGCSSKIGISDYNKGSDSETQSAEHKDMSSVYQEQRIQPCQLSSSIDYGGQDIYFHPPSAPDSGLNSMVYKKEAAEDDSGSASIGNWWKGSFYY